MMKRPRLDSGPPPWGALPTELIQDICSFLLSHDLAAASLTCRSWRTAACGLVTHLTLPLNHPLLVAGPARGWAECVARVAAEHQAQRQGISLGGNCDVSGGGSYAAAAPATPSLPHGITTAAPAAASDTHAAAAAAAAPSSSMKWSGKGKAQAAAPHSGRTREAVPLPRLRTDFPYVRHITVVYNTLLHRAQAQAAFSTLRALWPGVRGLSVHDSVTWDMPLDYSGLGDMGHITSLELLFQGQGGMDEAGQPMYRASMPHLCKLGQLRELCMKWIIGYDVDSFLDFSEVYDLLASLVRHGQLRSLQFGGENINAEGARHLASITSLETLNLVCDARPASPLHLLDLLCLPRLSRLELMHVCPDHAWNAAPEAGEEPLEPLKELRKRAAALATSPLRCLALSLSPGCQALVSHALPLLPRLHSLSVRVTSSEEEVALCAAFKAMQGPQSPQPAGGSPGAAGAAAAAAAPPPPPGPPPLRSLRLETAELGPELVAALGGLTSLTSLQLPRGLPSGDLVLYGQPLEAPAEAAAAEVIAQNVALSKYGMTHMSHLGQLTCLRRLMLQLDSPSDTAPAFVDGSLASVLASLPHLESLHLSTWNLLRVDPSAEALGPYPERPQPQPSVHPLQQQPPQQQQQPQLQPRPCQQQQQQQQEDESQTREIVVGQCVTEAAGSAAAPASAPLTSTTATAAVGASGEASGSAHAAGPNNNLAGGGAAAEGQLPRTELPCLPTLPTWAWGGLRSLSLSHWPTVYGKLKEIELPQLGHCYAVRWDDLPRSLEALLLVRCQLAGRRPPARLRHLWLADCLCADCPLPQVLSSLPELETLVLRWPSCPDEAEPPSEATTRAREQLLAAVTALKGLRTLGLGSIRCEDVPSLAPLSLLRHLMLEPMQPPKNLPPGADPAAAAAAQRDLSLLDWLMRLPQGALSGLRTLWLPNWAMPIKQLLQWQQMLQAAMPLVVLRVTEYDVVWTVPTPVMHVAQVEAPSSLAAAGGGGGVSGVSSARHGEGASVLGVAGAAAGVEGCGRNGLHAGRGLDGQELEWWRIGGWSVQ